MIFNSGRETDLCRTFKNQSAVRAAGVDSASGAIDDGSASRRYGLRAL